MAFTIIFFSWFHMKKLRLNRINCAQYMLHSGKFSVKLELDFRQFIKENQQVKSRHMKTYNGSLNESKEHSESSTVR